MATGLKPGDEVIFCSHTMVATASAIKTAGGTPVPVELGDDGLIDPDAAGGSNNIKHGWNYAYPAEWAGVQYGPSYADKGKIWPCDD